MTDWYIKDEFHRRSFCKRSLSVADSYADFAQKYVEKKIDKFSSQF